jgi:hypothetical protein
VRLCNFIVYVIHSLSIYVCNTLELATRTLLVRKEEPFADLLASFLWFVSRLDARNTVVSARMGGLVSRAHYDGFEQYSPHMDNAISLPHTRDSTKFARGLCVEDPFDPHMNVSVGMDWSMWELGECVSVRMLERVLVVDLAITQQTNIHAHTYTYTVSSGCWEQAQMIASGIHIDSFNSISKREFADSKESIEAGIARVHGVKVRMYVCRHVRVCACIGVSVPPYVFLMNNLCLSLTRSTSVTYLQCTPMVHHSSSPARPKGRVLSSGALTNNGEGSKANAAQQMMTRYRRPRTHSGCKHRSSKEKTLYFFSTVPN